MIISVLLAVIFTWAGLIAGYYTTFPVSFYITTFSFGFYVLARLFKAFGPTVKETMIKTDFGKSETDGS